MKIRNRRGNHLDLNKNSSYDDVRIVFEGKNNSVSFGKGCNIKGLRILCVGNSNSIIIGNEVKINASKIQPTVINSVGGKRIVIGDHSLLSNSIEIHNSDYHGIYNSEGNCINPEKDIIIGNHVWIGLRSTVLKGTTIADGCVVGAGSILAGTYDIQNCIMCGNPARVIKNDIIWDNRKAEKYDCITGM